LQNLYRSFGAFLRKFPNLEHNTFVVSQKHQYRHPLSFEKYSNCGWHSILDFNNGGVNVFLNKLDHSRMSQAKQTVKAYLTT